MPGGDGTGPLGLGPLTGRRLGYCAGFSTPGYTKSFGLGLGLGRLGFRGRGWRRGGFFGYIPPYFPPSPNIPAPQTTFDEKTYLTNLEAEKSYLEQQLKQLEQEITKLKEKIDKKS
ncbi:MAG: DUF5320 domain-containing protein [Promethearchaeota archaeon]